MRRFFETYPFSDLFGFRRSQIVSSYLFPTKKSRNRVREYINPKRNDRPPKSKTDGCSNTDGQKQSRFRAQTYTDTLRYKGYGGDVSEDTYFIVIFFFFYTSIQYIYKITKRFFVWNEMKCHLNFKQDNYSQILWLKIVFLKLGSIYV